MDHNFTSTPSNLGADGLVERIERLAALADERWAVGGRPGPPEERARELRHHVRSYLIPRARSLDAPLVVLVVGPTGAGKSSLVNTIAGARVSEPGVLRPTTRDAILVATADDARLLTSEGPLAALAAERLRVTTVGARPGVAVVDSPDVDSVERDNRALADTLVEIADLCIFVTTGTRYADRVPWDVLRRVRQRRLPLLVVVNRLPGDHDDARLVLDDVRRLITEAGLARAGAGPENDDAIGGSPIDIVGVREGALDADRAALREDAVPLVLDAVTRLSGDRDARREIARRALEGALAGIGPLVDEVADDLEHAAIDIDALRRIAAAVHDEEHRGLMGELRGGRFLREEVLGQWHAFVGADQVTRLFSSGIGRIRGTLLAALRGSPQAPAAAVERSAVSDLTALAAAHAAEAARRTAGRWSERPEGAELVEHDPAIWASSPDFESRLEARLRDWVAGIGADVAHAGASKRSLARGASLSINAAATGVMVTVFAHTGGLTGAEVGVAAGTAFLNQKLLNALFGEAAVQEMIARARHGLEELTRQLFEEERARFDVLAGDPTRIRTLAAELRAAASGIATH